MSRADELRAELAAAELEERFLEAKAAHEQGSISDEEYREVKQAFHDSRVQHRLARQAAAEDAAEGDATVTPETASASARSTDLGGTR